MYVFTQSMGPSYLLAAVSTWVGLVLPVNKNWDRAVFKSPILLVPAADRPPPRKMQRGDVLSPWSLRRTPP